MLTYLSICHIILLRDKEVINMKRYAVIYRGKKVDEIMAESHWDAVVEADKRGYSITMVDIVEVR